MYKILAGIILIPSMAAICAFFLPAIAAPAARRAYQNVPLADLDHQEPSASTSEKIRATSKPTCSLPGLSPDRDASVTAERLLASYNAQARVVRSLHLETMVQAKGGPEYGRTAQQPRAVAGEIDFQQLAWLRVTGIIPGIGRKEFDMASDGNTLRLLAPEYNKYKFFIGPVNAPPNSQNANENLRPQPFLDALRWQEGKLRGSEKSSLASSSSSATLTIEIPPRFGVPATAELEFDVPSGTVAWMQIYSGSGELLSQIQYEDWLPVVNSAPNSDTGCYPRRFQLMQPVEHYELDVRIVELELNPLIQEARFRMKVPSGIPVVRLGSENSSSY